MVTVQRAENLPGGWSLPPGIFLIRYPAPSIREIERNQARRPSWPVGKEMSFIMITAESKTENVIAAKQAGVNNYIVKPFNAATLKSKLQAVLGHF